MSLPEGALLLKKVELLRQNTDYRLLLETAAVVCAQSSELPEQALATAADMVLRPIARDLSNLVRGAKVMLHMYISNE